MATTISAITDLFEFRLLLTVNAKVEGIFLSTGYQYEDERSKTQASDRLLSGQQDFERSVRVSHEHGLQ